MPHVLSTLSSGVEYTEYQKSKSGAQTVLRSVHVNGGAGVARRGGETGVLTPNGVTTYVSDDDVQFLLQNEVFKMHMANGFVKILDDTSSDKPSEKKIAKEVAADMKPADESSQFTEADYKEGGRAKSKNAPKTKLES